VDLETQANEFKRLAGEVQEWDRVLMDNGKQINTLHSAVLHAEKTQGDVERALDTIEDQHRQLTHAVTEYERITEDTIQTQGLQGMDIGPADGERDRNYTLANTLNTQLDELARSLSSMIDEVNNVTVSSSNRVSMKPADNTASLATSQGQKVEAADDMDPMAQIQEILNQHLESLSWINTTAKELEGKVSELERKFGHALPAEERHAPPLGRTSTRGGLLQQQSTVLESSGGSRCGYSLRR